MSVQMLIGVDIGTQGTRAGIFDLDGVCRAEAFQKSNLIQSAPGVVEEDPETQLHSVLHTIRQCLLESKIDPGSVAAVAIDGQMAGIIGIGFDGKKVTPYDSWLDTRCAPYIAMMEKQAGDEVLRKCGGPPSFNHGPKILWWMHERPEVFRKIRAFVPPGSYAAMRLCGLKATEAYIDRSYLHFSGFADNQKSVWDPDLCRQFKLDMELLPKIVNSHASIGEIIPSMARQCGLKPGTLVIAGCGDTAASFLSCGATREGICVDVAGTASVFAITTSTMKPDLKYRTLACGQSAAPGLWHPYAYINGGGMNLEWFLNEISGQIPTTESGRIGFEALNQLAEKIQVGEEDPIFIPHLGGRVCPSRPNLRGAWIGLSRSHNLGHLYRAVLEGVALEYALYLEILNSLYPGFHPTEVRVTGGGGRSAVWNRIKADVLGISVVQLIRTEGAPIGSALLAGYGAGLFHNLDEMAGRWLKASEPTQPHKEHHSLYQKRVKKYFAILKAMDELER